MELNEKLQELRKQKGLTQEELAGALYVSRTAVSKWESNRGYPSIESLKALAAFFEVTVDELISGNQLLTIAEHDRKQKESHFFDLIFGLLDCSAALFFFLPLFAQTVDGTVCEMSILQLTAVAPYIKSTYVGMTAAMVAWGVLTLALQNCSRQLWCRYKNKISLMLNAAAVLLFIVSPQPYAAALLFVFLAIKTVILLKKQ